MYQGCALNCDSTGISIRAVLCSFTLTYLRIQAPRASSSPPVDRWHAEAPFVQNIPPCAARNSHHKWRAGLCLHLDAFRHPVPDHLWTDGMLKPKLCTRNFQLRCNDRSDGVQGYAYILTHPGTPCIFLDHLWTDGMLKPSLWRRLRSLLQVLLLYRLFWDFFELNSCISVVIRTVQIASLCHLKLSETHLFQQAWCLQRQRAVASFTFP